MFGLTSKMCKKFHAMLGGLWGLESPILKYWTWSVSCNQLGDIEELLFVCWRSAISISHQPALTSLEHPAQDKLTHDLGDSLWIH